MAEVPKTPEKTSEERGGLIQGVKTWHARAKASKGMQSCARPIGGRVSFICRCGILTVTSPYVVENKFQPTFSVWLLQLHNCHPVNFNIWAAAQIELALALLNQVMGKVGSCCLR